MNMEIIYPDSDIPVIPYAQFKLYTVPMTENRTSQAVRVVADVFIDAQRGNHKPEDLLNLLEKVLAIAEKYEQMEETIRWTLENGNSNGKAVLHLKHALSFDPLND